MKDRFSRFKMRFLSSFYDETFSSLMPLANNTERFLFIMGSGRNGSTLLSCILNNHPGICIPPEHHIIPETIRHWHLHRFDSWEKKVDHICMLLERPSQWNIEPANLKHGLLAIPVEKREPAYILKTIYSFFAPLQGKVNPIPGDKTPSSTLYLKMIKKQFPGAHIIFLLRDPRDVIASLLKANEKYYRKRFDFMLWRWQNSINKYLSLSKTFPRDVMLLKYENLVANPQKEVDDIIRFLNLEASPGLLTNYGDNLGFLGVKDAIHHQNILKPISTDSIGAWKHSLSKKDVERIQNKLGHTMNIFGYEVIGK